MIIQESFKTKQATLYLVATPIGNLNEMTPRALQILAEVDVIAAEDTRHTKSLLQHFNIQTRLMAHHAHNAKESAQGLIALLEEGKSIAVVSDAGYPCISDPGQELVAWVSEKGIPVVPISGSSAFINALVCSGLRVQPFLFHGFLASSTTEIRKDLEPLKSIKATLVFYVSIHKIEKTLETCLEVLGDRPACIARELTKQYETFYRGNLSELIACDIETRGELVLMIQGNDEEEIVDDEKIISFIQNMINQGISPKEAVKETSKTLKVPKNYVYKLFHNQENLL